MTTNVTIIGDALRLLGVIAETETPSSNQGSHALRVLNQLMESWDERGMLGYFAQSSTADTCPIAAWAELGVTCRLAQALQPTYPASSLAPWVHDNTSNGVGLIERKMVQEQLKPADMGHMPSGASGASDFDISSGW